MKLKFFAYTSSWFMWALNNQIIVNTKTGYVFVSHNKDISTKQNIPFKVSVNSTNSTILSLTFSTTNVPVESIWVDHVYILYAHCVPELLFHGGRITLGSILHVLFHCGILFIQSAVLNSFHLSNHNILIMNKFHRFFVTPYFGKI